MKSQYAERDPEVQREIEEAGANRDDYGRPGVYGIYEGDRLLYVGESKSLYARMAQHIQISLEIIAGRITYSPPEALYYHIAQAIRAKTLRLAIFKGDVEEKRDRLAIEDQLCIELGAEGLYNKKGARGARWPVISMHPDRLTAMEGAVEHAKKQEELRLQRIEKNKEFSVRLQESMSRSGHE